MLPLPPIAMDLPKACLSTQGLWLFFTDVFLIFLCV